MLTQIELATRFTTLIPRDCKDKDGRQETDIYFTHFSLSGLEEMHRYSKDERLYEFFEFDPFKTIDETKAYIEKLLNHMSGEPIERNAMYWFVRRKSDDYLIGTAGLLNLNYGRQSIELGYGMDPALWGYGYILQIQESLKKFTFEVLELNRLHGVTMVENDRTIQSVLASGMRHEGILRDFYCKQGVYHDAWQYGMIAKDYYGINTIAPSVSVSINNIIDAVSSVLTEDVITVESSMENTFSWDSLNHMAIMVALKSRLSIDLNPGEIAHMTTIQNIYNQIHGIK